MPNISSSELTAQFQTALREGWGYIYGVVVQAVRAIRVSAVSSSLSFIANKKKSIANDFHGASHMVPHPCF